MLPENPETRNEQYLANIAGEDTPVPETPITRKEQYLANIAGLSETKPEYPITREEQYLDYIAENGGGGGDVILKDLTVTKNGVTTAPSGEAYKKVTVNVPQKPEQSKSFSITKNGTATVTPDSGKTLSSVTAHVNVAMESIIIAWDGTTTGRDSIDMLGQMTLYKISNFVDGNVFVGATVAANVGGSEVEAIIDSVDTLAGVTMIQIPSSIGGAMIMAKAGVYEIGPGFTITVPSDGVYCDTSGGVNLIMKLDTGIINELYNVSNTVREVYSANDMTMYLEIAEDLGLTGLAYLYLGATDANYTNGDIYVIEEGA